MARIYRALAVLLSYPTEELQQAVAEITEALHADSSPSPGGRGMGGGAVPSVAPAANEAFARTTPPPAPLPQGEGESCLPPLLHDLAMSDIYDLQERYVALFDRGRGTSLNLFEHVHGESRDRGQAMADLIALYRSHGFEPTASELPDYLPLFLEFLSLLPEDEASAMLAEPAAILHVLADRLTDRDAGYAAVMRLIADLAGAPRQPAADDEADDPNDLTALDAAWEEAAVRFGPGEQMDGCSTDRLRTRLRAASRDAAAPAEETLV